MVIFERRMTIEYEADEWDEVEDLDRQVQYLLHCEGLHQCSRYRWNAKIEDDKYGYQTVEDSDCLYPVYIEDSKSFTLAYASHAALAVEGLIESGHKKARWKTETTTITKEKWMNVHGPYFVFTFHGVDGEADMSSKPAVIYGDKVKMVTSLELRRGTWILEFLITYDAETVEARREATQQLVDVPLSDMRHIRKTIESVLETYIIGCDLNFTVDCESCIKSETTAKCEPITIEKVMNDE